MIYPEGALILHRDFRKLVAKLDEHEKLLRDLSARVDKPDQIRIQKALDHVRAS